MKPMSQGGQSKGTVEPIAREAQLDCADASIQKVNKFAELYSYYSWFV